MIGSSVQSQKYTPKKYYRHLYQYLSNPDSLYVYEVSGSGYSGIAIFISFKDSTIKCGYYLSNDYLNWLLRSRSLMPKDSGDKIFRIIEATSVNGNAIVSKIHKMGLFQLSTSIEDTCLKSYIDDGLNYRLSKVLKDTAYTVNLYEIYEYASACPHLHVYQEFVCTDRLFGKYFKNPEEVKNEVLNEFRRRKKKEPEQF
jgi:hypothetical protein